ncbi:MAG: S9 family peptidase [Phycisphaerales bacterium]|nr:S9 family peptidase [Phycisphaerales bacterium]MCI0631361.1 S9 family peptidase [Phycisphaerales bacterium]MCI0675506.1 S9 family peptidase [Phycisphaerales bacterium]
MLCPNVSPVAILLGFALAAPLTPCAVAAPPEPELIPREVFFGNPDRANVQISPDGTRLSYLAANEGVLNVWVGRIGADDAKPVTHSVERPIRMYFWAENAEQIIYLQDREGDENFHLYVVTLASGDEVDLTPFDNVQARLVAADRDFPNEILVAVNNRDPRLHDVWRINTRSGDGKIVFQNDEAYFSIEADNQFNVRLASRVDQANGATETYTRDTADGPWYELARWELEDADTSGPLGFSRDGKTIYLMDSRGVNTGGLYAYTVDGEKLSYDLLASDARADLDSVVSDPTTGKPQAVAFEHARRDWKILDRSIQADWDYLKTVAEGELSVGSRNHADTKWIVWYLRDNGPVAYYLYDRTARRATFLFTNRPALETLELARMQPVILKARDGLELVSYLTTPTGRPVKNLPMVLLVHGGPWYRDRWGYNALHQWLADRGYAVLSVNFRGSTGFGKAFLNAGNREWAARMHDDLIDAVNWAVSQKIADPDRVAIMGGSYGGYATLVGLTFTPEFFAAGVDIVGPSHVRTLLESVPPYWKPVLAKFETRVGRLSETEFLDQISPLTRVDKIRRPLLIGQGRNDPRVKEAESQQIVLSMQQRELPVTYVVFPDEGHGFARPENNLAFFAVTESFLAQHLGGRYEPIGSALRGSTANVEAGAELIPGLVEALNR